VINLVTNAIKFTRTSPTRKITITVSASLESPRDDALGVKYVPRRYEPAKATSPTSGTPQESKDSEEIFLSFQVKDTGKGLTANEKAHLFNRFAQASPKTHIEYGGSGLGLFISRQITEMLGGEIGMDSAGGLGSIFAFYVRTQRSAPPRRPSVSIEPILELTRTLTLTSSASPLVVPPSDPQKGSATIDVTLVAPEPTNKLPADNRYVLVVEDNLVNQKVLCKLLRNRGFIVEATNHGQEALEAIRTFLATERGCSFDVVLCDIEMPVMGGIEFAKEVRSQESTGAMPGHVPIIGVTANVRSQQVSAAIEAGMVRQPKPYMLLWILLLTRNRTA
jgi:CheY-like chemotaxis protein